MSESKFVPQTPRLPMGWVIGAQGAVSVGLAVAVDAWSGQNIAAGLILSLTLLLFSLLAWWISQRHDRLGRWLLTAGSALIVFVASVWLSQPLINLLLIAPISVAVLLIDRRAGLWVAAAAIGLTIAWGRPNFTSGVIALGLGLSWLIASAADYWGRQLYEQGERLWESAERHLQAAQEQQAQFKFALEDLARANVQLSRLNALAQGLRQMAEAARADKERFAAYVSHEIRAPLNIILGFSNMILESPEAYGGLVAPSLQADLAVIQRNAAHLSALIDDVLDLSQMEAGHLALDRQYTDLAVIIHAVGDQMRGLFESKRLTLTMQTDPDLPAVFCDAVRIREVLINLVNNAWRFTERGGVTIHARRVGERAHVSVIDTGPGIPPDKAERLFRPFQQADSAVRKTYGGTGLGLAISKQIIELHGGRIGVRSGEQAGATFYFELPIDPPIERDNSFRAALREGWEFEQRTRRPAIELPPLRPRALVVEAAGDAQCALQRALQRQMDDVDIDTAPDLDTGQALLREAPAQAVVINAETTPQGLQDALAREWPRGVPVMVCAFSRPHDPGALPDNAVGRTRRLTKPVSRQDLAHALTELGVAGGRVLIVDDEPDSAHLLERMILGIQPECRIWLAGNSTEAMEQMARELPDLVLLDLMMPDADGWQLLSRREQTPAWSAMPVIIISAQDALSQPPVSPAIAFVSADGFSAQRMARSLLCVSRLMAPDAATGDSASPAAPGAPPA